MIKYNIQFFGGRGASGTSGISGAEISFNGVKTVYYFDKSKDGTNHYSIGLGGKLEPTPQNMTAREFVNRAKSNGADVKIISSNERKKREDARNKERENRPDYELGYGTGDMKKYAKQARRNRLSTRSMRKGAR